MAVQTEIVLLDDLSISEDPQSEVPAEETVLFGLDGRHYEIDLSLEHAAELRGALDRFVTAARRAGSATPPRRTAAHRRSRADCRKWAVSRGLEVAPRGRIPDDIMTAWETAGCPAGT